MDFKCNTSKNVLVMLPWLPQNCNCH